MRKQGKDFADREVKVMQYVKKLPSAKKIDNKCICHKANDKNSKVMTTCTHVFHPNCLIGFWHYNIEYQDFSCQICEASCGEAIKVIHVAGRKVQ